MSINIQKTNINSPATPFKGGAPKLITVGERVEKAVGWIGERSTPTNRFALGVTALIAQPWIDLHNKDVDEKTRKISWARTIAKNAVGTVVGISLRYGCIKAINALTRTPEDIAKIEEKGGKVSKWATKLIPTKIKEAGIERAISHEEFGKAFRLVKKHREALGSIIALFAMIVTNFVIDAPLTKIMTNKIIDKYKFNDSTQSNPKGGK